METLPSLSLAMSENQSLKLSIVEDPSLEGTYTIIPYICEGGSEKPFSEICIVDSHGKVLRLENIRTLTITEKALAMIKKEFSNARCIGDRVFVNLRSPRSQDGD